MKTQTSTIGQPKFRPSFLMAMAVMLIVASLFTWHVWKHRQPTAAVQATPQEASNEITAVEAGINTQQTEGKTNLATATVDAIAQKRAATLVSLGFDPNAGHKVGVKYETHKDPSAVK